MIEVVGQRMLRVIFPGPLFFAGKYNILQKYSFVMSKTKGNFTYNQVKIILSKP